MSTALVGSMSERAARCAECGMKIEHDSPRYSTHRWRRRGGDTDREDLVVCSETCLRAREEANSQVQIGGASATDERQPAKQCQNCQLQTRRTAKLVAVTPSGHHLHLSVCRDCYLHLSGRRAP